MGVKGGQSPAVVTGHAPNDSALVDRRL